MGVIGAWGTHTDLIIMKLLLVIAFILSLTFVTARPQDATEPEITKETTICEEPRDGEKFSLCHIYNWFTDLSNLIRATGVVAEKAGGEVEPLFQTLFQTTAQGVSYYFNYPAFYLDHYREKGVRSGYDWVKGPLVEMVQEMFDTTNTTETGN